MHVTHASWSVNLIRTGVREAKFEQSRQFKKKQRFLFFLNMKVVGNVN